MKVDMTKVYSVGDYDELTPIQLEKIVPGLRNIVFFCDPTIAEFPEAEQRDFFRAQEIPNASIVIPTVVLINEIGQVKCYRGVPKNMRERHLVPYGMWNSHQIVLNVGDKLWESTFREMFPEFGGYPYGR